MIPRNTCLCHRLCHVVIYEMFIWKFSARRRVCLLLRFRNTGLIKRQRGPRANRGASLDDEIYFVEEKTLRASRAAFIH